MSFLFEELDHCDTDMGTLALRRRLMLSLGGKVVHEVLLNDEYLMSSLFVEAEKALADLALERLDGQGWDVAVGGLGLGFTAAAVLAHDRVDHLVVIEALQPVIDWHCRGLVPNGAALAGDPRCRLVHADFFRLNRGAGFDPDIPRRRFDAVLLDIDHTPHQWLNGGHADFYTESGLQRLKSFLRPGGVFALWSNDPPEDGFLSLLQGVFFHVTGRSVTFDNPLQQSESTNGIYLAQRGGRRESTV